MTTPAFEAIDRRALARMTDEGLQLLVDADLPDEDVDPAGYATALEAGILAQQELDAREAWNSDDDRIRESVGNYRPAR